MLFPLASLRSCPRPVRVGVLASASALSLSLSLSTAVQADPHKAPAVDNSGLGWLVAILGGGAPEPEHTSAPADDAVSREESDQQENVPKVVSEQEVQEELKRREEEARRLRVVEVGGMVQRAVQRARQHLLPLGFLSAPQRQLMFDKLRVMEQNQMWEPSAVQVDLSALPSMIDHTLLKPSATEDDIRVLCQEAMDHKFKAVCVNGSRVPTAAHLLKDSGVKVAAVVGFPLGASTTAVKAFEATESVQQGAQEIDMVVNVGKLREGDMCYVFEDIFSVVQSAKQAHPDAQVKVILETGLLTEPQIVEGCVVSVLAGADFVKTSTGFAAGVPAATPTAVSLMRTSVGALAQVKASGGVRTTADAVVMARSGADRIGTSAGVAIVQGAEGAPQVSQTY